MKTTFALLVASTALTAIGVTAWSALGSAGGADTHPISAVFVDDGEQAFPLILAASDDDDDDRRRSRYDRDDDDDDDDHDDHDEDHEDHDDDDDHDEDHEDHDDDEDDDEPRRGRNPAPTGTVAPPANGLFGNGPPPRVREN